MGVVRGIVEVDEVDTVLDREMVPLGTTDETAVDVLFCAAVTVEVFVFVDVVTGIGCYN